MGKESSEKQIKISKFNDLKERYISAYEISNKKPVKDIFYQMGYVYIVFEMSSIRNVRLKKFEEMTIELESRNINISEREWAMKWWNGLKLFERAKYMVKCGVELFRSSETLTGSEIEKIYAKIKKTDCADWMHDERAKWNNDNYCPLCGTRLQ